MTPFPQAPEEGLGPRAPAHVGIIMDGNGRWAQARGLPRFEGHRRGVDAVRRSVHAAIDCGVSYLTIYSFSTENWLRPPDEVALLMGLLKRFIRNDLAELHANDVRVLVIGGRERLQSDIAGLIIEAEELTQGNRGLTLIIAFNYGGRQEIVEAARRMAAEAASGVLDPREINESSFELRLSTAGVPDPDLIIRTSGEQRLSNFLLWQAAYAEFVFLPIHWPDFDKAAFQSALDQYAQRDRRFGGAKAPVSAVVKSAS